MLLGGGRAGKTFKLIRSIVIRACKAKSTHVIGRLKFSHCKKSIWLKTLPDVFRICFPDLPYKSNNSDYYITLPNGSQIWIAGFDDGDRVQKILGMEFSTIYFNECSQIPYSTITTVLSRLAEKSPLHKKAYYDMNPPSKRHWSYWLFIKHQDPVTGDPVKKSDYTSFLMNPADNIENIDPIYLEVLKRLPQKEQDRFLHGLFSDTDDGIAYYEFNREKHVLELDRKHYMAKDLAIGVDFNVSPGTAVIGRFHNDIFYCLDEVWIEDGSTTEKVCLEIIRKGYSKGTAYPDSTGKNRKTSGHTDFQILKQYGFPIQYTNNPHQNDRVNNVNRLFKEGRIIIDPRCKKLINDLEKVSWRDNKLDQKGEDKKFLTHISDGLGYWTWNVDNGLISNLPKDFKFNQRRTRF